MNSRSLTQWFTKSLLADPQKTAITFLRDGSVETTVTGRELERDALRMAGTFLDMGVAKGDRVVLLIEKSLIFVVAHLSLQKLGAISVPLNPGFTKSELQYLLGDARPKAILTEPGATAMIGQIDASLCRLVVDTQKPYQDLDIFPDSPVKLPPVAIRTADPALIIYTSGTTGKPKGAVLAQQNLVHDACNIIDIWKIRDSDVICHVLPLFHVHGLCFALHTSLMAGARVVMLDRFAPRKTLEVLSRKKGLHVCTVFMAVPAMYTKLVESLENQKPDFKHVRLWASGSAPLAASDFERLEQLLGKPPVEREGMSETGMNFSNPLDGKRKPGSIGKPLPDLEVRIVDPETGADVLPGQTGEIWLKGPSITPGYWQKPVETAAAFEKGWFKTGDLGKMDDEGYYFLTDRIKHIIISGGENISPKEVEQVINGLEDVAQSCVVGLKDKKWGEKVAAAVVKKPGAAVTAEEVLSHCKTYLHPWKCPRQIVFTDRLPRNSMGKVLKEAVKKLFGSSPD